VTWWAWALIAWLVLSVPVAVLIGRSIALADRRHESDGVPRRLFGDGRKAGPSVPLPRGDDDSDGRRASAV
jgi:hypothetical protein